MERPAVCDRLSDDAISPEIAQRIVRDGALAIAKGPQRWARVPSGRRGVEGELRVVGPDEGIERSLSWSERRLLYWLALRAADAASLPRRRVIVTVPLEQLPVLFNIAVRELPEQSGSEPDPVNVQARPVRHQEVGEGFGPPAASRWGCLIGRGEDAIRIVPLDGRAFGVRIEPLPVEDGCLQIAVSLLNGQGFVHAEEEAEIVALGIPVAPDEGPRFRRDERSALVGILVSWFSEALLSFSFERLKRAVKEGRRRARRARTSREWIRLAANGAAAVLFGGALWYWSLFRGFSLETSIVFTSHRTLPGGYEVSPAVRVEWTDTGRTESGYVVYRNDDAIARVAACDRMQRGPCRRAVTDAGVTFGQAVVYSVEEDRFSGRRSPTAEVAWEKARRAGLFPGARFQTRPWYPWSLLTEVRQEGAIRHVKWRNAEVSPRMIFVNKRGTAIPDSELRSVVCLLDQTCRLEFPPGHVRFDLRTDGTTLMVCSAIGRDGRVVSVAPPLIQLRVIPSPPIPEPAITVLDITTSTGGLEGPFGYAGVLAPLKVRYAGAAGTVPIRVEPLPNHIIPIGSGTPTVVTPLRVEGPFVGLHQHHVFDGHGQGIPQVVVFGLGDRQTDIGLLFRPLLMLDGAFVFTVSYGDGAEELIDESRRLELNDEMEREANRRNWSSFMFTAQPPGPGQFWQANALHAYAAPGIYRVRWRMYKRSFGTLILVDQLEGDILVGDEASAVRNDCRP